MAAVLEAQPLPRARSSGLAERSLIFAYEPVVPTQETEVGALLTSLGGAEWRVKCSSVTNDSGLSGNGGISWGAGLSVLY